MTDKGSKHMNTSQVLPGEMERQVKNHFFPRKITALLTILFAAILIALTTYFFSASSQPVKIARASTPPTVDGYFYKTGEDQVYWPFSKSLYGSNLYLFVDEPRIYVALVVTRTVSDNACSPVKDYTTDAGWNPGRDCKKASDSEYASWTLRCTTMPNEWQWLQALAVMTPTGSYQFTSDNKILPGSGTAPPGYQSGSSVAANWNAYFSKPYPSGVPWDIFVHNASTPTLDMRDWTSPFDPSNPISVAGHLDGYPATGMPTYSSVYDYEWAMVYEWSADVSTCGSEPLFIITGQSHHSPGKNGEENDPFDDSDPLLDYGDLPDSYSTYTATNGAAHKFILGAPRLGGLVDFEKDGAPSTFANGDDSNGIDDHDGVTRDPETKWQNGASVNISLDVQNCTGTAVVAMWIDWDQSGTFEADEYYTFPDLTCGAVNEVSITVPGSGDYTVGDPLNTRVRIFSDGTAAPGGSLDSGDFAGTADNGEVEDYTWNFGPTAIALTDFSASSSSTRILPILMGALVVLAAAGIVLRKKIDI
jgi:hypothetical protein